MRMIMPGMKKRMPAITFGAIPVIKKMGNGDQQAADWNYNSLVPALHKQMPYNNNQKTCHQQNCREQTMMRAKIRQTDSVGTHAQGKNDHTPFNERISQKLRPANGSTVINNGTIAQ